MPGQRPITQASYSKKSLASDYRKPGFWAKKTSGVYPYMPVFILLFSDEVPLFLLYFVPRLSLDPSLGEPVVNTSPAETAPLALLGIGAVPLGTVLGLEVLGEVCEGVVWAEAALKLHKPAASSRG